MMPARPAYEFAFLDLRLGAKSGLGIHQLLWVQRIFRGRDRDLPFMSVGAVGVSPAAA